MKTGQRWVMLSLALAGTLLAAYFAPSTAGESVMLTAHAQQQAASATVSSPSSPDTVQVASRAPSAPSQALALLAITQRSALVPAEEQAAWTVLGGASAEAIASAAVPAPPAKAAPPASAQPEATPPPPPPQAPALPFKWLGWARDGGQASAFLQYEEQNLVVKVGDRIDGRYSVERIDAQTLTFVYLPLGETQTLNVSSGN